MAKAPKRVIHAFDGRDFLAVLGLALLIPGLAMVYVPAALIVPGGLFLSLAMWRISPPRRQ